MTPNNFKVFLFNLTAIVLIFGVFELYFKYVDFFEIDKNQNSNQAYMGDYVGGKYVISDTLRGYTADKDLKITSRKIVDGKMSYNVTYTTNKYGLRVAPHDLRLTQLNPNFKNVIFFGCSFTFGEGVNDNESIPFVFEDQSQGHYKAYNFAFHGYGAHQMLRILESDTIDKVITDRKPAIAIYQACTFHIERSAFKYPYIQWDTKGPRYRLDRNGNLVLSTSKYSERLFRILSSSHLFSHLLDRLYLKRRTEYDIRLFIEMIKRSKKIFEDKYNGEFYVVYWDTYSDPDTKKIMSKLEKEQIGFFYASKIFGVNNMENYLEKYAIAGEGHPNKLAYELIAKYLLQNIF